MAIINDKLMDTLYDEKDTSRYAGQSAQKDDYLTDGPGAYCLKVLEYKTGVSESEKRFGQSYVAIVFEVVHAEPIRDRDGKTHQPKYAPGKAVTMVKYMNGRISVKELLETTAAIVGTPPAIEVPDGPHAGKILPMVGNNTVEACSEDDGARVAGSLVWVDVVPNTKTKGEHAGKTFFNPYPHPATEDGKRDQFPNWAKLVDAGVDMDALVKARFGSR